MALGQEAQTQLPPVFDGLVSRLTTPFRQHLANIDGVLLQTLGDIFRRHTDIPTRRHFPPEAVRQNNLELKPVDGLSQTTPS
jgi:hypothetical protein